MDRNWTAPNESTSSIGAAHDTRHHLVELYAPTRDDNASTPSSNYLWMFHLKVLVFKTYQTYGHQDQLLQLTKKKFAALQHDECAIPK